MRIYDEPIAVLFDQQPRQFIWRGRLLLVKQVQARWTRSAQWWRKLPEDPERPLLVEKETWRLEAGNGSHRGVYQVSRTVGEDDWQLQAVVD